MQQNQKGKARDQGFSSTSPAQFAPYARIKHHAPYLVSLSKTLCNENEIRSIFSFTARESG